jgi:hypothetical protein
MVRVLTLDLLLDSPLLLFMAASWKSTQVSNELLRLQFINCHNKVMKIANQLRFHFSQFFRISEMKVE